MATTRPRKTDRQFASLTLGADPVAWLAAADWLEERGRNDEARRWRGASAVLSALLEAAHQRTLLGGRSLAVAMPGLGRALFIGLRARIRVIMETEAGTEVANWLCRPTSLRADNVRWLRDVALGHEARLLRAMAEDSQSRPCRFCQGDETAYACECV